MKKSGNDLLARAEDLRAGRTPFVLATVVRAQRPTSAKPGDRALVLADGTMEGFVGGGCAQSTVRLHGLRLLRTGESALLHITPDAAGTDATEGLVTVGNPCASGGTLDIFLEAMLPAPMVRVFGDSPVARALVRVGQALGYDAAATADATAALPADLGAMVVASHGGDEALVLAAALRAQVPYVALVASRRRGAAVLAELDLPGELTQRVHTPAGLDIGARTAAEVALSVYAEMVTLQRRPEAPVPEPPVPVAAEAVAGEAMPTQAVDPVCGMTVAITPDTLSVEHEGRTVYFCAPGCRRAFLANPAAYFA